MRLHVRLTPADAAPFLRPTPFPAAPSVHPVAPRRSAFLSLDVAALLECAASNDLQSARLLLKSWSSEGA